MLAISSPARRIPQPPAPGSEGVLLRRSVRAGGQPVRGLSVAVATFQLSAGPRRPRWAARRCPARPSCCGPRSRWFRPSRWRTRRTTAARCCAARRRVTPEPPARGGRPSSGTSPVPVVVRRGVGGEKVEHHAIAHLTQRAVAPTPQRPVVQDDVGDVARRGDVDHLARAELQEGQPHRRGHRMPPSCGGPSPR